MQPSQLSQLNPTLPHPRHVLSVLLAWCVVVLACMGTVWAQPADTNELVLHANGELTPYAIDTQPYDTVDDEPANPGSDDVGLLLDKVDVDTTGEGIPVSPDVLENTGPVVDSTPLETLFARTAPVITQAAMVRVAIGFVVVMVLLLVFFRWGLPWVLRLPSVQQRMNNSAYKPSTLHQASPQNQQPVAQYPYVEPPQSMPPHPTTGVPAGSSVAPDPLPTGLGDPLAPLPAEMNAAMPMTVVKRFQLNRHDGVELVTIWDRYFLVANSRLGSVLLAEFAKTEVMDAPYGYNGQAHSQGGGHPWQPYGDTATPSAAMTHQWVCQPSDMPMRHPSAQWLRQYPQIVEESLAMLNQPAPAATELSPPQLQQQPQYPPPTPAGWAPAPQPAAPIAEPAPLQRQSGGTRLGQLLRKYAPSVGQSAQWAAPSTGNPPATAATAYQHAVQQLVQQETAQWAAPSSPSLPPSGPPSFSPDIHSQVPHQQGGRPSPAPAPSPRFSTKLSASAPQAVERLKQLRRQPAPPAKTVANKEANVHQPDSDAVTQRNVLDTLLGPAPRKAAQASASSLYRPDDIKGTRLPDGASLSQPLVAKTVSPVAAHPVEEAIEVYDDYDDTF